MKKLVRLTYEILVLDEEQFTNIAAELADKRGVPDNYGHPMTLEEAAQHRLEYFTDHHHRDDTLAMVHPKIEVFPLQDVSLSLRETSAILAGLRALQDPEKAGERVRDLLEIASDGGSFMPLDDDEIGALIAKLNLPD